MRTSAYAHVPKARAAAAAIGLTLMITMSTATADDFVAVDDDLSTNNGVVMDGDSSSVTTPSPTASYGFPQDLWDPEYDCPNAGGVLLFE